MRDVYKFKKTPPCLPLSLYIALTTSQPFSYLCDCILVSLSVPFSLSLTHSPKAVSAFAPAPGLLIWPRKPCVMEHFLPRLPEYPYQQRDPPVLALPPPLVPTHPPCICLPQRWQRTFLPKWSTAIRKRNKKSVILFLPGKCLNCNLVLSPLCLII